MKLSHSISRLILVIILSYTQFGFSQNRFETGYYINNDGEKISCLIESKEWANWPNDFFNTSVNGKIKQILVKDIREFGIDDKLKFINREVLIEKSSDIVDRLDNKRDLDFNKEKILLKVIVEGDLSLYIYLKDNIKKFFIKTNNNEIEQLKYKRYKDTIFESEMKIKAVVDYKKQLKKTLKCSFHNFEAIQYVLYDLKKYVLAQNECSNTPLTFVSKRSFKPRFVVTPTVGLIISNLDVYRSETNFSLKTINPSFGIDLDYLIPTIKNEIEVNLKAQYFAFDAKEDIEFRFSSTREVQIKYSEVLLGVGGGYRFYLSNRNSITLAGGLNYPILLEDTRYQESGSSLDLHAKEAKPFPSLSAGVNFNKLKFRAHYLFKRNIMEGVNNFKVDLSRVSASIGYEIF